MEMEALEKIKVSVEYGSDGSARAIWASGCRDRARSLCSLIVVVVAIGVELARQSMLSIEKFGFSFWRTDDVGSGGGRFRRPAVYLGHAVLVGPGAAASSTPIALGIAIFLSELSPTWLRAAARVPHRTARGHPVDRLRLVGHFRARAARAAARDVDARLAASAAALQRPAARRRHAVGRADSRDHGHPVHARRSREKC